MIPVMLYLSSVFRNCPDPIGMYCYELELIGESITKEKEKGKKRSENNRKGG